MKSPLLTALLLLLFFSFSQLLHAQPPNFERTLRQADSLLELGQAAAASRLLHGSCRSCRATRLKLRKISKAIRKRDVQGIDRQAFLTADSCVARRPDGSTLAVLPSGFSYFIPARGSIEGPFWYLFPNDLGGYIACKNGRVALFDRQFRRYTPWCEGIGSFSFGLAPATIRGRPFWIDAQGHRRRANPHLYRYRPGAQVTLKGRNGRFGFRDAFNRTTVPPVYDEIRRTLSGAYSVTLDSLNYLLNASGHRFFPNRYEAVEPVRGLRLLAIRENGLWGLADSSGRVLLPPQLDERFYLNPNKQAIVKQAGKYGLMDTTGAWRLQPEWDEIRNAAPPSTGYQLRRNSLWGLADRTGIVLLPPAYDWFSAEGRPGNLLLTKQQGKYGLINHRGELLLQAEYAGIYLGRREFDPYILVLKNDRYGLVDSLGRIRIPVDFQWIAPFSADLVWVKQEERWGLWDLQRDSLRSPPRYRDHRRLSEGLCAVKVGEKWGFIDSTGRMTLEPQYLDAQNFSEGLAPVRQISEQNQATQSFWGYIDRQGNWVIPPIFFQAQEFQEGRAPAEESGKGWGLIDRAGQWVIEPQYHGISPCIGGRVLLWELPENARQYLYGVASCKGRLFLTPEYESVRLWGAEGWYFCQYKKENGRYGLIDAGGRHWLPEGLDEIRHMASGFAVRMGERWSWAPLTGGPATPFVFENIRDVERAILFWQNGKIGMLAPNGQVVLPAQFSNLHLNTSYLPNSYHLSGPWGSIQLNARGEYILEAEPGAARR